MSREPSNHEPDIDPQGLWQSQTKEYDPITLEQIYALARDYDRKIRWVPLFYALCLVLVGVIGAVVWFGGKDTLGRAAAVLFVLGEASVFLLAYRVAFPARDPAETAGAYHRRRLRLKLAYAQGRWTVVLIPILPFLVVAFLRASNIHQTPAAAPLAVRLAPVAVLFAAWLLVFLMRNRHNLARTKDQLKQLEDLMDR